MTNFQKSNAGLATQKSTFEREDWSLFRTIEGLQQRAGVPKNKLSRLVLKELADNGLDNGAEVTVASLHDGSYVVEDDGAGIDGAPEDIARLFSISRPMFSTKLLRLPTRGALGNGLRVVTGAVLVSGGSLVVTTRNRRIRLRPERDGTTTVTGVEAVEFPVGTRVEVRFGPTLPCDQSTLYWAQMPFRLARLGAVGPGAFPSCAYAITYGMANFGSAWPQAEIPFVVEAWAEEKTEGDTCLCACVNRTPATGDLHAARDKREINGFGCGLAHTIAKAPSGREFDIWVNVTTPYMPITSDGKAQDLKPFLKEIQPAVSKPALNP